MTAQQGKEEVGLSSKKKFELSGGRFRKLILKTDEITLLDFSALFRCVFEQIKNIIKWFLYFTGDILQQYEKLRYLENGDSRKVCQVPGPKPSSLSGLLLDWCDVHSDSVTTPRAFLPWEHGSRSVLPWSAAPYHQEKRSKIMWGHEVCPKAAVTAVGLETLCSS